MHTICRKFTFDAAHRVLNHTGKCKYIHGHRYVAEVYCYAAKLDAMGMVVDFGLVKDRVGWWIDNNLDHNVILHPLDPLTTRALFDPILFGKEPFVMPDLLPQPTAENIAQVIYTACTKLLPIHITVQKVRLYETENCWADFLGPPHVPPKKEPSNASEPATP